MKTEFPKINRMGERAVLIEFGPEINEIFLRTLLSIKNSIEKKYVKEKVEVINTYNSLLVYYHTAINISYEEVSALKRFVSEVKKPIDLKTRLYQLPVCYDAKFGLDLLMVSEEKKLSVTQIIQLHSQSIYTVYFTGFLPGFLYLGGLDKRLQIPRKNEPRQKIEKGAVGLGGNQTGIYPNASPGGWQIIGNSPVPLFDKNKQPPCEISAGDKIKFYPISKKEHKEIIKKVESGKFRLKNEIYEA